MSVPATGSTRSRAQVVVALALLVIVACAALALIGVRKLSHDANANPAASAGSSAGQAAGATGALTEGAQLAVDFTSFNYKTLDQDFVATAKRATPAFAKVYLAQSRAVASLITKAKAVSISQVVATGLQSFSPTQHTATVIVALNDTTKNTKSPAGTVQYFRMQVQMLQQNGKWLATGVTPQ